MLSFNNYLDGQRTMKVSGNDKDARAQVREVKANHPMINFHAVSLCVRPLAFIIRPNTFAQ